jgi:hypothetical protein
MLPLFGLLYLNKVLLCFDLPTLSTEILHSDCTLIGGTSLVVSLSCHYHSPPTLLLNVPGQVAAFWEINKKNLATDSLNKSEILKRKISFSK